MLHAVRASVLPLAALAGAGVIASVLVAPSPGPGPVIQRLVLHAPEEPGAFYISAWACDDVTIILRDGKPRPLTFKRRAHISDGCEWLATERLVPVPTGGYAYSYDEEILSCEPGAIAARKTPRTGFVSVEVVR